MGGACTAVTEDDEAIFLNPAAMAGNKGATLYLLNADGQVSKGLGTSIKSSTTFFSRTSARQALNNFMSDDLGAQGNA